VTVCSICIFVAETIKKDIIHDQTFSAKFFFFHMFLEKPGKIVRFMHKLLKIKVNFSFHKILFSTVTIDRELVVATKKRFFWFSICSCYNRHVYVWLNGFIRMREIF
jgi:hypothetical protein